jgi:hypothetical protein
VRPPLNVNPMPLARGAKFTAMPRVLHTNRRGGVKRLRTGENHELPSNDEIT